MPYTRPVHGISRRSTRKPAVVQAFLRNTRSSVPNSPRRAIEDEVRIDPSNLTCYDLEQSDITQETVMPTAWTGLSSGEILAIMVRRTIASLGQCSFGWIQGYWRRLCSMPAASAVAAPSPLTCSNPDPLPRSWAYQRPYKVDPFDRNRLRVHTYGPLESHLDLALEGMAHRPEDLERTWFPRTARARTAGISSPWDVYCDLSSSATLR